MLEAVSSYPETRQLLKESLFVYVAVVREIIYYLLFLKTVLPDVHDFKLLTVHMYN